MVNLNLDLYQGRLQDDGLYTYVVLPFFMALLYELKDNAQMEN